MRTTVELTKEQHESLLVVARRRGMRGFSQLVQEALDAYLSDLREDEIEALLSLEGSISADEESELRHRIETAEGIWRAS